MTFKTSIEDIFRLDKKLEKCEILNLLFQFSEISGNYLLVYDDSKNKNYRLVIDKELSYRLDEIETSI